MKNVKQDFGDSLRPEYKRSDFGEMVQGKYATAQLAFAELVPLLLACVGEDEGLKFIHHSADNPRVSRRAGDWTYELDTANQITLRYWLGEVASIKEPIANLPCVNSAQERSALQGLLVNHVRALKSRLEDLNR